MFKVFEYYMAETPWIGVGTLAKRIDVREALHTAPLGLLRRLHGAYLHTDGVAWTPHGNSYVMVEGNDFYHPKLDRKVSVISVNPCGETRWKIHPSPDGGYWSGTSEDEIVMRVFGLDG